MCSKGLLKTFIFVLLLLGAGASRVPEAGQLGDITSELNGPESYIAFMIFRRICKVKTKEQAEMMKRNRELLIIY